MSTLAASDCVIQTLRTATILWRESRRFFRRFGLTEAQFNVLNLLGPAPEGLSQRELSDLLVVDRSNITLLLDRMARRGWVARHDVPKDRRRYQVRLTREGIALWKKVLPHYERALRHLTEGLSAVNVKNAHRVLQVLESQAKRWESHDQDGFPIPATGRVPH
jgi:MarR family 2-MHQ and catechol resistance regulon transcriptional repressor